MYKFILLLLIIVGCKSQSKESSFSSLKNNKGITNLRNMKIAIGNDHAGVGVKEKIKEQ